MSNKTNHNYKDKKIEGVLPGGTRDYKDAKRLNLIDGKIKGLLSVLNVDEDLITLGSCEGHGIDLSKDNKNNFPYVLFQTHIEKLAKNIKRSTQKYNLENRLNYQWKLYKNNNSGAVENSYILTVSLSEKKSNYIRSKIDYDIKQMEILMKKVMDRHMMDKNTQSLISKVSQSNLAKRLKLKRKDKTSLKINQSMNRLGNKLK